MVGGREQENNLTVTTLDSTDSTKVLKRVILERSNREKRPGVSKSSERIRTGDLGLARKHANGQPQDRLPLGRKSAKDFQEYEKNMGGGGSFCGKTTAVSPGGEGTHEGRGTFAATKGLESLFRPRVKRGEDQRSS